MYELQVEKEREIVRERESERERKIVMCEVGAFFQKTEKDDAETQHPTQPTWGRFDYTIYYCTFLLYRQVVPINKVNK